MIDEQTRSDPALLARLVDEAGLTDLDITPSHADLLLEHLTLQTPTASQAPLTLLVGGEAIRPALWERLADLGQQGRLRAFNLYGPTECTVDATARPDQRRGGAAHRHHPPRAEPAPAGRGGCVPSPPARAASSTWPARGSAGATGGARR